MKTLLLLLVSVLSLSAQPTQDLVIAVASDLPPAWRSELANRVASLLYLGPTSGRLTILDASHLQDLAAVDLTGGSPRLRQQRHRDAILKVYQSLRTAGGGEFNVPRVLEELGRRFSGRHPQVLLIGPALHHQEAEPAHDLRRGWPSDGHLAAGRRRSIFSTVERAHLLEDITLHWLVTDDGAMLNESHRDGIGRFWSLYVATQGGVLATFSPNLASVFDSALTGRRATWRYETPNPADQGVVLHTRQIDVGRQEDRILAVTNFVFVTNRVFVTNPVPVPAALGLPVVAAGNTGLGLLWGAGAPGSGPVDLDLYVTGPRDGVELCFRRTSSPSGRYYRDIRQALPTGSANWRTSWEFVELDGTQLPSEVWINLYSGQGPVQGELRVQYAGREHVIGFTFPAVSGNRGVAFGRGPSSPEWLRIDLRSLAHSLR